MKDAKSTRLNPFKWLTRVIRKHGYWLLAVSMLGIVLSLTILATQPRSARPQLAGRLGTLTTENKLLAYFSHAENMHMALILMLIVGAAAYLFIDYQQHRKPLRAEKPDIRYSFMHHLKVVRIPIVKYKWRGLAYISSMLTLGLMGLTLTVFYTGIIAYAAGPLTVTINQKVGQPDPTGTLPVLFTAAFSSPIDVATFTADDVQLGGTAPGKTVASITEVAPNDDTTFEIAVTVSGEGTITATLPGSVASYVASTFIGVDQTYLPSFSPFGILVSDDDTIYITDFISKGILSLNSSGISVHDGGNPTGTWPQDIAMSSTGILYVANGRFNDAFITDSSSVSRFLPNGGMDRTGTTFATFATPPSSIELDSADNVYVTRPDANVVSKITPGGVVSTYGTTGGNPQDMVFDQAGNLYVTNRTSNNVTKITPGGVSSIFGTTGTSPGSIAIDANGNIYTANPGSNNITKITPGGVSSVFGTTGTQPLDIIIDAEGNAFVTNYGSNNITKITPAGVSTIIASVGSSPYMMAKDSNNNLYVVNYGDQTVSKITTSTTGVLDLSGTGNQASTSTDNSITYGAVPTVLTSTTSSIAETTASLNGSISDLGTSAVTTRGFEIGLDTSYTLPPISTSTPPYTTGAYAGLATGLTCGTTYHVRAFATNNFGIGHGNDETFDTDACPVTPTATPTPSPTPTPVVTPTPAPLTPSPTPTALTPSPTPAPATPTPTPVTPLEEITPSPTPSPSASPASTTPPTSGGTRSTPSPSASPQVFFGFLPVGLLDPVRTIPESIAFAIPYLLLLILLVLALTYARQAWLEYRTQKQQLAILARYRNTKQASQNFVGLTSHYLNTPIGTMQLAVELLQSLQKVTLDQASRLTSALQNLAADTKELVVQSQVVNDEVEGDAQVLEIAQYKNPLRSIYVWLPILIIGLIVVIINLIFTEANRYNLTLANVGMQALCFVLAGTAVALAYRSVKLHATVKDNAKKQAKIEVDLLTRRVAFIRQAHTDLTADLAYVESIIATLIPDAALKPLTSGCTDLRRVLTAFGRLEEFSQPPLGVVAPLSVTPVVQSAIASYTQAIQERGLKVTTSVPANLTVNLTTNALQQLVFSVINNAVKFSKPGGTIEVIAREMKGAVEIVVKDAGVGIDPEQLGQLMTPFSRATDVLQFDYEGLGLSLYLNKVILEQAGGTILIASKPQTGTTVTLHIPSSL